MSTVDEIERAIERLSPAELHVFRAWFAERDAAERDKRFEADAQSGKLDWFADEALREHRQGRSTSL